jgi:hypothetical protein
MDDEATLLWLQQLHRQVISVYTASLRRAFAMTIDYLQSHQSEQGQQITFGLSNDERDRLNRLGTVTIDLVERVRPNPYEENRRIALLAISQTETRVHVTSPASSNTAYTTLRLLHRGDGAVRSGGKQFVFRPGTGTSDNPFVWGAVIDAISRGNPVRNDSLSVSGVSLLKTVLGAGAADPNFSDTAIALFAHPTAEARLTIEKFDNPQGVSVQIDNLRLTTQIEFSRAPEATVLLQVAIEGGHLPLIQIDTPDRNNRKDGIGSFTRVYSQGTVVSVTAPARIGNLRFWGWLDENGRRISSGPRMSPMRLDNSRSLRAVFR